MSGITCASMASKPRNSERMAVTWSRDTEIVEVIQAGSKLIQKVWEQCCRGCGLVVHKASTSIGPESYRTPCNYIGEKSMRPRALMWHS